MQCVPSQELPAQLCLPPAAVVRVRTRLLAAGQVQVPRVRAALAGPQAVQAPSAAQGFAVADACAHPTMRCLMQRGRQTRHPVL